MSTEKKHRRSRRPPAGNPVSDKRLSLCGRYLRPRSLTDDHTEVTCEVCLRATDSKRTREQGRLA